MTMSDSVYGQTTIPHCSNVIVLQKDHLVCVLDNGAVKTISGDTVEVFTHTEFSWYCFHLKLEIVTMKKYHSHCHLLMYLTVHKAGDGD